MTLFMLPVTVYGQEHDSKRKASREEVLRMDIDSLGEMVRNSHELFDDFGYIGSRMLPDRLYIPDDYVSP
jgi:hypothetical protein